MFPVCARRGKSNFLSAGVLGPTCHAAILAEAKRRDPKRVMVGLDPTIS
jgi:hypothetical protein